MAKSLFFENIDAQLDSLGEMLEYKSRTIKGPYRMFKSATILLNKHGAVEYDYFV
jgi:hypothetical protein